MSIISDTATVRYRTRFMHKPPSSPMQNFLFVRQDGRACIDSTITSTTTSKFGAAPNWLWAHRGSFHLRRSVTPAYLQSRSTLSRVSLSACELSLSLSFSFPQPFAHSRILALAHRGGQHGDTSRFHSPRGCAKRRLSRRPWRNSQYSPESRWRYVFLLDLIREISVTSERKRERERERERERKHKSLCERTEESSPN